jgi:hypothetical protein
LHNIVGRQVHKRAPTSGYDQRASPLTIRLHPHDAQHFDTGQLQTCPDYTLEEAQRDTE